MKYGVIILEHSQNEKGTITLWKKNFEQLLEVLQKWGLFLLPKPFKVLNDNQAATTFVKQALDNRSHM